MIITLCLLSLGQHIFLKVNYVKCIAYRITSPGSMGQLASMLFISPSHNHLNLEEDTIFVSTEHFAYRNPSFLQITLDLRAQCMSSKTSQHCQRRGEDKYV